jgi:hypothetical protein
MEKPSNEKGRSKKQRTKREQRRYRIASTREGGSTKRRVNIRADDHELATVCRESVEVPEEGEPAATATLIRGIRISRAWETRKKVIHLERCTQTDKGERTGRGGE